ncbi:methionyl-tRNA formyltransferase [Ornithinimicrobium sp. Y1847]|uniref:methionyl-tRNA formyltransferase n=1 Tax=unclassified Ornithinimicrobium TaxID=2615080 RepID=UPI003B677CC9
MRIVFAGTPEVAVPSLRALLDSNHEIVGVLTRPDAGRGRGRRATPSPVRVVAEEAGIPVLTPERLREPEVATTLQDWGTEAVAVVAYGNLVPPELLGQPRHGWVNLHFSLLPAWRGAAPVQHALLHGDDVTGAVTFVLEEGLDTGPILGRLTESVRPGDTSGALLERLAWAGADLLVATMDALEAGTVVPEEQPSHGVSHAPKVGVEDARVDWSHPALAVDRRIRAMTPAPGAWTTFRGERLKLGPVSPVEDLGVAALAPGQVRADKKQVLIGTATVPVRLGLVTPHGKREMPAADWARGSRIEEDEQVGA